MRHIKTHWERAAMCSAWDSTNHPQRFSAVRWRSRKRALRFSILGNAENSVIRRDEDTQGAISFLTVTGLRFREASIAS